MTLLVVAASVGLRASAQQASTQQVSTQQAFAQKLAPVQQVVTVTADRGLLGTDDAASSVAVVSQQKMQQAPGLALDDKLHQVAGFELFRRTSSWTANPTSQGVSLRGLGSTAASRTLVISDEVPLNDPFGGWIHWDEIPALAIQQVQLLRGGGADLYGSSAIGGVIDVVPTLPVVLALPDAHKFFLSADASGATENSAVEDALLSTSMRHVAALGAISALTTQGYVPTAPAFRGSIDTQSNVTDQAGRLELRGPVAANTSAFLRGNLLNEARDNGTPLQTNGMRLWRYIGGSDWSEGTTAVALRTYGSRESYRQSFSSIAANRDSEKLTRLERVPTDELGLVAQASHQLPHALTAALGFDVHDIRATDDESAVSNNLIATTISTSARQRDTGGFADAIWQPRNWSVSASIRVDSFRTFAAQQTTSNAAALTPLPEIDELFASPHIGIVHSFAHGFALTGNAFRAFRGPTMNELYRTGQTGQQTTLANNSLRAERATGFEAGGNFPITRAVQARSTAFWTEVNRPISAVLLSQTATSQTLQRQNLGQIRSRGFMLEASSQSWRGLDATLGYQLAFATVTAYDSSSAAQNDLVGKWIPEVPREVVTATVNYIRPNIANFHIVASYTGEQFDDSENQFVLHPFARFDLSADRKLRYGLSIFASAQNLLNRSIEAARTPVLMLAAPRLVQAGLRYSFSR